MSDPSELKSFIERTIEREVERAGTTTGYRKPIVGFADADDPLFPKLRQLAESTHWLPEDLLPGARAVVSFFLPFETWVLDANAGHRDEVAREWAVAYVETNALINHITRRLIDVLAERGIRAGAEQATDNFDPVTLISRWSHKSVAVIAGVGSFGLHHLVITDAGCAGRFGSLVMDAPLPIAPAIVKERCLYFHDGSCLECVWRCPVDALDESNHLDKQRCWNRLLEVASRYQEAGNAEGCGKCAIGPCSFESAV